MLAIFLSASSSSSRTGTSSLRRCCVTTTRNLSTKRPRPSSVGNNNATVEGVWYGSKSSSRPSSKQLDMGRYGLKRFDYKKLDPEAFVVQLPPHPPTKTVKERVVFPLTLVIVAGLGIWAYMNPEEDDMRDYWKRVETGQILVDDDDDDDDYDDDEDEFR
mmetsp:Transcript_52661/g.127674  ORF Transcript_52661/g.127674 Transcript_52661/m.127674 type:complete len:160 (-) Transcript_52661:258-737(-)